MRKTLPVLALLAMLASAIPTQTQGQEPPPLPAPGLRTNSFVLEWDPHPDAENILATHIYVATNLAVPTGADLSLTNVPTEAERGTVWRHYMTLTNVAPDGTRLNVTSVRLTNYWSGVEGAQPVFFSLTASNSFGESPFSNVAWLPVAPQSTRLKIATIE